MHTNIHQALIRALRMIEDYSHTLEKAGAKPMDVLDEGFSALGQSDFQEMADELREWEKAQARF